MLKNKNQEIVSLIAKKNMKGNKTRNLLTTLAIILTTFMFTTVFTIGCSLAENMSVMMVREQGGRATIFLPQPTNEQIEMVSDFKNLSAAGIRIHVETLKTDKGIRVTVDYYDKTEFEGNYTPAISHIKGSYPEKENEIMMSISAMEELGIISDDKDISHVKKGMSVTIPFSDEEETFLLSGWFRDYETFSHGCHVLVSKAYADSRGLTVEDNGILSISAQKGRQQKLYKELTQQMTLEDDQEIQTSFEVEESNSGNNTVIIVVAGLVGLMIVLSGYLLIYNIMYISVSRDIRFYGLLKAIGTTPAQLASIVRRQVWRLSVVGIPVGILLGSLCAFIAVPMAVEMFTGSVYASMPNEVKFRPVIFAGTILFAIVTVLLSCRKPARKASTISPVEAMKYHGISPSKESRCVKKNNKVKTHGGKPYKMAWKNVFREKKRAVLVFVSLFLGIMTFVSIHVFFGCITLENYVKTYLPYDYNLYMSVDEEGGANEEDVKKLAEELISIRGIIDYQINRSVTGILDYRDEVYEAFWEEAVQDIGQESTDYMRKLYEEGKELYGCQVIAVDEDMIERYNKKAYQPIDIEQFKNESSCIIGCVDEKWADDMVGKNITVMDSQTGRSLELKIGSADTAGYGLELGYYWQMVGSPHYIVVSQETMNKLSDNPAIENVIMNCDKEAESYVTTQVHKLIKNNSIVYNAEIKSERIKGFQSSMTAMNVLTSGISLILILIGVLNFVNVMLTGVYSRRKELAMLESIGMTKKQNCRMLMCEGIYYGVITVGLILTLGSGIIGLVAMMSMEIADYAIFYYPWKLLLAVTVIIFVICILVPIMVYINVSKESVVDRLRAIE